MISLKEYMKGEPILIAVHGTLSDDEPKMGVTPKALDFLEDIPSKDFYQNHYHPSSWQEKIKQCLKLKPHISGNFVNQYSPELWSPIGLILENAEITDIGNFSKVLENGERVTQDEFQYIGIDKKLKYVLDYNEVLFKDPIFSAIYVVKNSLYINSNPQEIETAKNIAKEYGISFKFLRENHDSGKGFERMMNCLKKDGVF